MGVGNRTVGARIMQDLGGQNPRHGDPKMTPTMRSNDSGRWRSLDPKREWPRLPVHDHCLPRMARDIRRNIADHPEDMMNHQVVPSRSSSQIAFDSDDPRSTFSNPEHWWKALGETGVGALRYAALNLPALKGCTRRVAAWNTEGTYV